MPYLLELDASNNMVSELLNFKPPLNLKSVNLSFNNIHEMKDLSSHHYLQTLILDSKSKLHLETHYSHLLSEILLLSFQPFKPKFTSSLVCIAACFYEPN